MSIRNCSVLLDVSAQTLVYFVRHVSDLPTQLTRKMARTTEFSISHTIKKLQKNKVTLEFFQTKNFMQRCMRMRTFQKVVRICTLGKPFDQRISISYHSYLLPFINDLSYRSQRKEFKVCNRPYYSPLVVWAYNEITKNL